METLLAIITMIQRAGGKWLVIKLFSRFVLLLALVLTTTLMISATLVGGLIQGYLSLLNSGVSLPMTLLLTGSAALFIIAALVSVIVWQIARLHPLPKTSPIMDTLEAFSQGFMAD